MIMKNIDEILENLTVYDKNFNIPFYNRETGKVVIMDPVVEMYDISVEDPTQVVIITSHDVNGQKKYQDWIWNYTKQAFVMITINTSIKRHSPKTTWKNEGIKMHCPKKLTKDSIITILTLGLIMKNEAHD